MIGREIVRRGECVFAIDVDGAGLRLTPATSLGSHRERRAGDRGYTAFSLRGLRAIPNASRPPLAWCTCGPMSSRPHRGGVSRLSRRRGLTARLLAEAESALADESGGARGYVLPVPQGPDGDESNPLLDLQGDIANLKGRTALVETVAAGWGEGRGSAPASDWQAATHRRGLPGLAPRQLRGDAEACLCSPRCGCPVELDTAGGADGAAVREAWRSASLIRRLGPIGEHVAAEIGGEARAARSRARHSIGLCSPRTSRAGREPSQSMVARRYGSRAGGGAVRSPGGRVRPDANVRTMRRLDSLPGSTLTMASAGYA